MHRKQIYLDFKQIKILKKLAAQRGLFVSELIREAIWEFIFQHQKTKKDPIEGIIALYKNSKDSQGSLNHDDIYE
jgi:metal-responsive CopG/Arc/MetJ family transcriptional regulator